MFTVSITLTTDAKAPKGKLADASLLFNEQTDMDGLSLVGFSVWEGRQPDTINVSFPSRSWTANGERRSFALLREADNVEGPKAKKWLSDLIVASYREAAEKDGAQANTAPTPKPTAATAPTGRSRR